MLEKDVKKIHDILLEEISSTSPVDHIDEDMELKEYGLNSINFIKVVVMLEKYFCIEFDDDDLNFENFNSIRTIIDYIEKKKA